MALVQVALAPAGSMVAAPVLAQQAGRTTHLALQGR
jgi:hypothetical protein